MTELLLKVFLKKNDSRDMVGKLAGWVGVLSNLLLFVIKMFVGFFTSSIAIMTDAVNNLADGSSSLITIVGFHLSAKPADEEHPYGHARIEYISGLLVAGLIFFIGAQFFITSIKKTINPEPTNLTTRAIILLLISIAIKIWQAMFNQKLGKKINSQVLLATAVDSRNDVIITSAVLLSALVEFYTDVQLDGPIGMLVAILVVYSGIELAKNTLAPLLGQAPSEKLLRGIKRRIFSYPHVLDVHDLVIHTYGSEQIFATVHVEMPASLSLMESHEIVDSMERDFLRQDGIHLVAHIDPIDTDDPDWESYEMLISNTAKDISTSFSVHGFRLVRGKDYKRLLFDVQIPPEETKNDKQIRKEFEKRLAGNQPALVLIITVDREYTSTVN